MSFQVQLAVYDLSRGMARGMSQAILGQQIDGIWHTGIIVYGNEYYFGGGIQVTPWGMFSRSNNIQAYQVLDMGVTSKTQAELEQYLRSINHQYTQATYDLINNNCNNFADIVCKFLTTHGIPSHIVDLPRMVFSTPGGAMLRPMIESMQNNIRQQHGGMGLDPFGSGPVGATPPTAAGLTFESALSESVTSIVLNTALQQQTQQSQPQALKLATLEEAPLISADGSSLQAVANKIFSLVGSDGVKGTALTETQKTMLQDIITTLNTPTTTSTGAVLFSTEQYSFMEALLADYPQAHMPVLFVLRLMFLHDHYTDYEEVTLIHALVQRLLSSHSNNNGNGFASIAAHVMALCAIANLFAHSKGSCFVLGVDETETTNSISNSTNSSANTALVNDLIDIVLAGIASTNRAEIRQMSATLGYNITLACTKQNTLSGPWKNTTSKDDEGEEGLHSHAVQLLCGCLEGIDEEQVMLLLYAMLCYDMI